MGIKPSEGTIMHFATLTKVATALALLAAAPAAAQDTGARRITWSKDNPLIVLSNGQSYTKIDTVIGDFVLRGEFSFSTEGVDRIKSWAAWPSIWHGYGIGEPVPSLKAYKVSKSYGIGSRPKDVDENLEFSISYSLIEPVAVRMCNQKAAALREAGKSDKQIFGQNHEVSLEASLDTHIDTTGITSDILWEFFNTTLVIPVRCAKWNGAQVPQGGNDSFEDSLRVLSARLKLTEQITLNGSTCRVKTATAVRANKAGATIKYRFVHSSGKESPTFSIKTEANKIAVINRTWDVPNEDGKETGWFQVEGVGVDFETAKVFYNMDCPTKAPGGLVLEN
jgi:hypothetical protein